MKEKMVEFTEGEGKEKERYRLIASYGFQSFLGQEPYFSITADLQRKCRYGCNWRSQSFGCLHDEIAEYIPELEPLIKWHLVSFSQPLHYIANGMFWWDRSRKTSAAPLYRGDTTAFGKHALEHFKSTIIFGAIEEGDWAKKVVGGKHKVKREDIQQWLFKRLPALMEAFQKDMIKFGVE